MTPDLEKSIIEKYPSLFANVGQKGSPMCFGLEVGDGWAGIISTMCWIINQKDTAKKFRFDQVKEKFGLLRVYHTGGNEYMAGVVRMACDISGRTCEVCGQPGEQRKGGWIKTLCGRCHAPPSDIVARLREEVAWEPEVGELMSMAATEIEVQRACTSAARDEIERLRGELAWTARERDSLRVAINNLRDGAVKSRETVQCPTILADYREWRSKQEDRIGTHSDRCHMWMRHERCMIHRLAEELERLSQRADFPEPENETKQDIQPLAAGGRAAIRDGGSGNLRPPHPTPVRSSPVTDDRPAPTAEVFPTQNMTTLTAAEREAVAYYLGTGGPHAVHSTLLGLFSRTGSDLRQTSDNAAECHSRSQKNPERERLTDAEREAVELAYSRLTADTHYASVAATLRGLLERLSNKQN